MLYLHYEYKLINCIVEKQSYRNSEPHMYALGKEYHIVFNIQASAIHTAKI
jgi:hypothetical protein